jgi:hypothetical protein
VLRLAHHPKQLRTLLHSSRRSRRAQGFGGFGGGGNQISNVVPTPAAGETYRFYWSTPIALSPHNPRVVYTGGDRFFKSMDRGDTWTASADLTKKIDRNTLPIMGVPGKGSDGLQA